MSKELKSFFNVGAYVFNIVLAISCMIDYYHTNNSPAFWWALGSSMWMCLCLFQSHVHQQYREITEVLITKLAMDSKTFGDKDE